MLRDFLYLFYPTYCSACNIALHKNERLLCTNCRHKLPLGDFHNVNAKKIEKVFYGRVKIENATALFVFQKNSLVQNLIHNLKYKGKEEIGKEIGGWKYIDTILKKKLHTSKQSQRNRENRWNNIFETFDAKNESLLENKHVLLVDDIITTGATIEACIDTLKDVANIKISIATMAITE